MTMTTESRDTTRPLAATSLVASIARHFASYRTSRRVLSELGAMDDHILKDIGLSRAEVNKASVADMGTDRMAMLDRARARLIA
jgi:uncharacterized protein YjiS (DUF1127 family)